MSENTSPAAVMDRITEIVSGSGAGYRVSHQAFDFEQWSALGDRVFQVTPGDFERERISRGCVEYERTFVVTVVFAVKDRSQHRTFIDKALDEEQEIASQLDAAIFINGVRGSYSQSPDGAWVVLRLSIATEFSVAAGG